MNKPTYEEIINHAKMNSDCGEHMSPAEIKELVLACEAQVKQLAAQLELSVAAERAWETTMMRVCGEDGPLSVAGKFNQLAAENAVKQEFISVCFRAAGDGSDMDGNDIQELGERLGLFERQTYQPALHGYICGHEAGEDSVYVMKASPATDAILASLRAEARKQGAVFAANRMLAAWDAGFVEDTPEDAADIARAILMSTEFMDEAPDGDFDRSFADEVLEAIAAQLRSKSEVQS